MQKQPGIQQYVLHHRQTAVVNAQFGEKKLKYYQQNALHRLIRAQQELINTITRFSNFGFCYEVVGGTTIQKRTCIHKTKHNM